MIGQLLVVAVGGAFGAMARYGASLLGGLVFGRDTWVTTFAINVVGAFLLGALAGLVTRRVEHWQLLNGLVAIGFLGAFTTFSTYALETVRLWQEGRRAGWRLASRTRPAAWSLRSPRPGSDRVSRSDRQRRPEANRAQSPPR